MHDVGRWPDAARRPGDNDETREVPLRSDQLQRAVDRKSTRLNSSHDQISYAVFCLKKHPTPVDRLEPYLAALYFSVEELYSLALRVRDQPAREGQLRLVVLRRLREVTGAS